MANCLKFIATVLWPSKRPQKLELKRRPGKEPQIERYALLELNHLDITVEASKHMSTYLLDLNDCRNDAEHVIVINA